MRDEHPGVRPAAHAPVASAEARRRDGPVGAVRALRVAHVGEPLREEAVHIGVVYGRAEEGERVARPAHALVPLRTVRRHGEVIRVHPPADVGDQPVDGGDPRRQRARLHLARDGRHGHAPHAMENHRRASADANVPESEKRIGWPIPLAASLHRVANRRRDATKVRHIGRPLRPVIAPALRSAALVQHLGMAHRHLATGRPLHVEVAYGRRVLPEIHHQLLSGANANRLPVVKEGNGTRNAVGVGRNANRPAHEMQLSRLERKILAQDDRRRRRTHLAPELEVAFRPGPSAGASRPSPVLANARVIRLAVVDGGRTKRAGACGAPRHVGPEGLLRAIRILDRQLTPECVVGIFRNIPLKASVIRPQHIVRNAQLILKRQRIRVAGLNDFVSPPARRDRGRQHIDRLRRSLQLACHIEGIDMAALAEMRESRLQEAADLNAVDERTVDAKSRRPPYRVCDRGPVGDCAAERSRLQCPPKVRRGNPVRGKGRVGGH